jgi:hypothetical protein
VTTVHQPSKLPAVPPHRQTRFNRFFARWLASPLGGLSGGAVLVRYKGRVSGAQRQLPVYLRPIEGGYLIRVGGAEQKKWWRNFRSPWPIEIVRGGRTIEGTGLAVSGDTERGRQIAADFFAEHRSAARRAGLPKVAKGERHAAADVAAAAAGLVFVVVSPDRPSPRPASVA